MSDLFRREALDNHRERLLGDVVLVQPLSFWVLTGFVTLVVVFVALLLLFGTYARRENVVGFVAPDRGLVKVYANERGLVEDVHVEEGERVAAGDVLFTVSTNRGAEGTTDVDALILEELLASQTALERRLRERRELNALQVEQQRASVPRLEREIARLERLLELHEERASVSREQLDRVAGLAADGFVPDTDLVAAREADVGVELALAEARRDLATRQDELADARNRLRELPLEASLQLADLDERLSGVGQRILETNGRRAYTLRAPSAGRVTALQATPGQQAGGERPLLTILPDASRFRAELFVPTRAIGFVEPGQSVLLRYSAFPHQRFGVHEGTVTKVAETILLPSELDVPVPLEEPVYRVSVLPDRQTIEAHGREFDLQAGMLLEASIVLEGRSLGQWLLAPIYGLRGTL